MPRLVGKTATLPVAEAATPLDEPPQSAVLPLQAEERPPERVTSKQTLRAHESLQTERAQRPESVTAELAGWPPTSALEKMEIATAAKPPTSSACHRDARQPIAVPKATPRHTHTTSRRCHGHEFCLSHTNDIAT